MGGGEGRGGCHKGLCRLVLPSVRTAFLWGGLGFQEDTFYIVCPQMVGKRIFGRWEWDVLPVLTSGWHASHETQDCEVWRVLITTDVGNVTQGFHISKCYTSAVHNIARHLPFEEKWGGVDP